MKRILIVEDDRFLRRLYRDLLEAEGLVVSVAVSAAEGIEWARRDPPDLILMDIELPGMNGLEATAVLKEDPRTQGVPVVVISAHAMGRHEQLARDVGCDRFLKKPLAFPDFQQVILALAGVG